MDLFVDKKYVETYQVATMHQKSFAKVNLILDLGEKNNTGRYETEFVMQEIALHDLVDIADYDDIVIECKDPTVPIDGKNLCYRAVEVMRKISGSNRGARISIKKGIPAAGGLGGGSSNAALVVHELNKRWQMGLSDDELIAEINPILGTDASFFVKGGTGHVMNNGVRIEEIRTSLKLDLIFILPDVEVPGSKTEDVYRHFDPARVSKKPNVPGMIHALETGSLEGVAGHLFNAFEFSLPPYYRVIPKLKSELMGAGCLGSLMCGAGPVVFGICRDRSHAEEMAKYFRKRYPLVFVSETRTQNHPSP